MTPPVTPIAVLMYHEVEQSAGASHPYAVTDTDFEQQLEFLKSNGYSTMLLNDYFDPDRRRARDLTRTVVLTFDDTHISSYTRIYPLLVKYGFQAEFFIATQFIGSRADQLNAEHLVEMASRGMSIQSHTHTHAYLDDLRGARLADELKMSKDILEDICNREVTALSCPGGKLNHAVPIAAKAIGYKGLCTSKPGECRRSDGLYILGRFLVSHATDVRTFWRMVSMERPYILRKKLEYSAKGAINKALGNALYHRLWKLARGSALADHTK